MGDMSGGQAFGGDRRPLGAGAGLRGGQMGARGAYAMGESPAAPPGGHGSPAASPGGHASTEKVTNMDKPKQIIVDGDFLPPMFRTQAYEIARDVCRYMSRGEDQGPPPTQVCSIMRSLVDDTIKDKPVKMRQLVRTLDVRTREQLKLVRSVADEMFGDEQVNWGRIVTLHAYCALLAKHCEQHYIPDCADDIGNILADFVINRLGLWIVTHGGWVSLAYLVMLLSV